MKSELSWIQTVIRVLLISTKKTNISYYHEPCMRFSGHFPTWIFYCGVHILPLPWIKLNTNVVRYSFKKLFWKWPKILRDTTLVESIFHQSGKLTKVVNFTPLTTSINIFSSVFSEIKRRCQRCSAKFLWKIS